MALFHYQITTSYVARVELLTANLADHCFYQQSNEIKLLTYGCGYLGDLLFLLCEQRFQVHLLGQQGSRLFPLGLVLAPQLNVDLDEPLRLRLQLMW